MNFNKKIIFLLIFVSYLLSMGCKTMNPDLMVSAYVFGIYFADADFSMKKLYKNFTTNQKSSNRKYTKKTTVSNAKQRNTRKKIVRKVELKKKINNCPIARQYFETGKREFRNSEYDLCIYQMSKATSFNVLRSTTAGISYFFIGASHYYKNDFVKAKIYFKKSIKYTHGRNISSRIDTSVFRPELMSLYIDKSPDHPAVIPSEMREGAFLEVIVAYGIYCEIMLDGKKIGYACKGPIRISPGKHKLKLVLDSMWPRKTKIEIKDGEIIEILVYHKSKFLDIYHTYKDGTSSYCEKRWRYW